jgi:multidrug efflux pump subunit AcrB
VAAGRYGLTVEQVSDQLAGNWLGEVATDLRLPDRTIPVRVRLPDSFRLDPNRLPGTLIPSKIDFTLEEIELPR